MSICFTILFGKYQTKILPLPIFNCGIRHLVRTRWFAKPRRGSILVETRQVMLPKSCKGGIFNAFNMKQENKKMPPPGGLIKPHSITTRMTYLWHYCELNA